MPGTSSKSLSEVVDQLAEAQFYRRKLAKEESDAAAEFIASRQGGKTAYGGTFALSELERTKGVLVFTGERIMSASARHIMGEESCRALRGLRGAPSVAKDALAKATQGLQAVVVARADADQRPGVFCCGKCSVAYWRHLSAGGFDAQPSRLENGLAFLRAHRDGRGGWARFPFFYTLLSLVGIDEKLASKELEYAAPTCESLLKKHLRKSKYSQRRHDVMRRALDRV